ADRHRTGDLRHDVHPVLDQVEGVRPLDVAYREDALGAEEERLGEDLADGVLAHEVEEGDVGEGDVLAFQADLQVRWVDAAAERAGVRLREMVLQVPLEEARLADPPLADEDDLELHLADAHGREESS